MGTKFKRFSVCVDDNTYESVNNIAKSENISLADATREIIKKGLAAEWVDENKDLISSIVREELKAVLKPNIERLAALSSKSGHMAATAAFLNVQALMDLVPNDRRRNVREMYDSARKKSVEYMRTKTEDWDIDKSAKGDK